MLFFFRLLSSVAQPANDNCSSAQFIPLTSTGDTCLTIDNTNATADGYFNTCDQGATFPLPPGGNEIWYTYIASGDSNFISVSPSIGVGSMVDPSITVITGNCGSFSTLTCDYPLLGTVSFNVPVGTQVWFYVTALTSDGTANVCINSQHTIILAGTTCATAVTLCDKLKLTARDPSTTSSGGIMPGCFNTPPQHTLWYKFTVGTSGTLKFVATPNGPQGYQWALWDITNGCSSSAIAPVSCNAIYNGGQPFGIADNVTSCQNNSFCPTVPVTAGNTYALMINDSSLSHQGFDLQWGGTFEMAPTSNFTVSKNYICGYDIDTITYAGNGSSTALYNWNFGAANASLLAGQKYLLSFPSTGTYLIKLQVAENGCISPVSSKQIVVNPIPIANAGTPISFCSASGNYLIGLPPLQGYTYHWLDSINIVSPDSSQTLVSGSNNSIANQVVTYTMVATLGLCRDSSTVDVTIKPQQSPFFQTPSAQCFSINNFDFKPFNDSVPGSTFNWIFQNGQPATNSTAEAQNIHFTTIGQSLVTLSTTTPGCPADTFSQNINVLTSPTVSFYASTNSGCPPLVISLYNTSPPLAGAAYLWNPQNGSIDTTSRDTISITYNDPGTYLPMLTLTSPQHCSTTDTINIPVKVYPPADANFYTTPLEPDDLNPQVTFSNNEPGGVCSYLFGDGDSSIDCNAVHSFPDTGSYPVQLIVTSINGCVDTTVRIIEIRKFFTIYIPTAFTPNHDGRNDLFQIKGDGITRYRLRIFNRRGQIVFVSDDETFSWNGTHIDTTKQVPEGIYLYDLRLEDTNHKKHQYNGSVLVIR